MGSLTRSKSEEKCSKSNHEFQNDNS